MPLVDSLRSVATVREGGADVEKARSVTDGSGGGSALMVM